MTMAAQRRVLTINRGSSTSNDLYQTAGQNVPLLAMSVDQAIGSGSRLKIADSKGRILLDTALASGESNAAVEAMLDWLGAQGYLHGLAAVGHRLVHGGSKYREPQRVTAEFMTEIEKIAPLDPGHLPAAISGIRFISAKLPQVPQVACFDTAFHPRCRKWRACTHCRASSTSRASPAMDFTGSRTRTL